MKKHLLKSLLVTSLIMTAGCGSTRVVQYDSKADWILAGPRSVIKSAYVMQGGKWTLVKGPFPLVEGARIGPPTSP